MRATSLAMATPSSLMTFLRILAKISSSMMCFSPASSLWEKCDLREDGRARSVLALRKVHGVKSELLQDVLGCLGSGSLPRACASTRLWVVMWLKERINRRGRPE